MTINNGFEVLLASVPYRDELVAEIWHGDSQLAEVRREGEHFLIEVYPNPKDTKWTFEHSELVEALNTAERRLRGTVA